MSRRPVKRKHATELDNMGKCKAQHCPELSESKGYCKSHYNSLKYDITKQKKCTFVGCEKGQRTKGLCTKHYRLSEKCKECKSGTVYKDGLCKKHYVETNPNCTFPECDSKEIANYGQMLCAKHYHALRYEKVKKKREEAKEAEKSLFEPKQTSPISIRDYVIT